MSRTIWKFPIAPDCVVQMPKRARILSAAAQGKEVCIWALVDPGQETRARHFRVFGTGDSLPVTEANSHDWQFIGTVLMADGALVFHVWEDMS